MQINVIEQDDTITHIALTGRLDIAGVQEIELKFLGHTASRGKPAIIDMSGVDYVASLGLRMILGSVKSLKSKGAKAYLIRLQPLVRETMELAGLDTLIAPTDDVEVAKKLAQTNA